MASLHSHTLSDPAAAVFFSFLSCCVSLNCFDLARFGLFAFHLSKNVFFPFKTYLSLTPNLYYSSIHRSSTTFPQKVTYPGCRVSAWTSCQLTTASIRRQTPTHTHSHTWDQCEEARSPLAQVHVFELWQEAGENPGGHGKNRQTPHGEAPGPQWGQTHSTIVTPHHNGLPRQPG